MALEFLQLPEELLIEIIERVAALYTPSSRLRKAGFQSLLDETSVYSVSLTCRTARRIALPILFRSLRILPGFLSYMHSLPYVRHQYLQPITDTLRASPRLNRECVKHVHVLECKGDLHAFVMDFLSLFPRLESVELPTCLWNNAFVLQAVKIHPALLKCVFKSVELDSSDAPYDNMEKIVWETLTVTAAMPTHHLDQCLQAGVEIENLRLSSTLDKTDWAHLKFPASLTSIRVSGSSRGLNPLPWAFVAEQTSIQTLHLLSDETAKDIIGEAYHHFIPVLKEDPPSRISFALLKKIEGMWKLRELSINFTVQDLDTFSTKLQRLGRVLVSLESLCLTISAPSSLRLPPNIHLENLFGDALSTFRNLRELLFDFPYSLTHHIDVTRDPEHWVPSFDLFSKAILPLSNRLAVSSPSMEKIVYSGTFRQLFLDLLKTEECVVIIERVPAIKLRVFQAQASNDHVRGGVHWLPVGEEWSESSA